MYRWRPDEEYAVLLSLNQNIGHFHSAGVPGRFELRDTEVNYPAVIKAIEKTGYDKYFGLEFWGSKGDDTFSVKDNLAYCNGK